MRQRYPSRMSSSRRPSPLSSFFTALDATTVPSLAQASCAGSLLDVVEAIEVVDRHAKADSRWPLAEDIAEPVDLAPAARTVAEMESRHRIDQAAFGGACFFRK